MNEPEPLEINPPSAVLVEAVSRVVAARASTSSADLDDAVDRFVKESRGTHTQNSRWAGAFFRHLLTRAWQLQPAEPERIARELISAAVKAASREFRPGIAAAPDSLRTALRVTTEVRTRVELLDRLRVELETGSPDDARDWLLDTRGGHLISDAEVDQMAVEVERRGRRLTVLNQLKREFEERFLGARDWLLNADDGLLITDAEFDELAAKFVIDWCSEHLVWEEGRSSRRFIPSEEQARVIACVDRHALVEARAGSGKTATMVARIAFIVSHCGVEPQSILMLAFNRDAATEVSERLKLFLGEEQRPHVMTFHALAKRLVEPEQEIVCDERDGHQLQSALAQRVVDRLAGAPDTADLVRSAMLEYFEKDWPAILVPDDAGTASERLDYRAMLTSESIKGDWIRSYGEKRIANALFKNGFHGDGKLADHKTGEWSYFYERWWTEGRQRPDFTIVAPDGEIRVVIEYFGLYGRGFQKYDETVRWKREFWSGYAGPVERLFYHRADIVKDDFEDRLVADVRAFLPEEEFDVLSPDDLWGRVQERVISQFALMTKTIIQKARQRRWGRSELLAEWERRKIVDGTLDKWNRLQADALQLYEEELKNGESIDFMGLMWLAVDRVAAGHSQFSSDRVGVGDLRQLRYVVVDEFQDFSDVFHELIQAILVAAPEVGLMAVGDVWQAINGFAGATAEYFTSFEQHFENAARLQLTTNRRSDLELVSLGNRLMEGRGKSAIAERADRGQITEWVLAGDSSATAFIPSDDEKVWLGEGRLTPALIRLIESHRRAGRSVAVLSRRRRSTWRIRGERVTNIDAYGYRVGRLLDIESESDLRFSSVHAFKGQEADAVIVLNVHDFPLLHPSWPLTQVFGDTVETLREDERNLFYVALSRARTHLDIVVSRETDDAFWPVSRVSAGNWDMLPEVAPGASVDRVLITVSTQGGMSDPKFKNFRTTMRDAGFKFSDDRKWSRQFAATSEDLKRVKRTLERFPEVKLAEVPLNGHFPPP